MPGWSGWSALDGSLSGGRPVVEQNADGRLELLAEAPGASGPELAHIWQTAPNGGWDGFASLGAPPAQFLGSPAVGRNPDGRLEAFVRVGLMSTGALWHIWQTAPNGGWSGWDNLGGGIGPHFVDVGQNADGRLEVFAVGSNAVWHIAQTSAGAGWGSWDSLGTPPGATFLRATSVGQNADGRLELFVPDLNGGAWHSWQASPGGSWGSWDSLGGGPTSPAVGAHAGGRLELFA